MRIVADFYFANRDISGKEILWTALGLTALLVSLWNLRDAMKYLRAARAKHPSQDGELTVLAKAHIENELLRILIDVCIIFTGVTSMTLPTPEGLPSYNLTTWGILVAFYLIPSIMLFKSLRDAQRRHRFASGYYRQRHA